MSNSFMQGDVVERLIKGVSASAGGSIKKGTLGTICRVVTPGRSYKIRYEDFDICLLVFHDSIRKAPTGSVGPECESDC